MANKFHGGVYAGQTDYTEYVVMHDSTTGAPKTGLVYTDFTVHYVRSLSSMVQITLSSLASNSTAHTDGGVKEIDATNGKGIYRIDYTDAVFATGADVAMVNIVATGCDEVKLNYKLDIVNIDSSGRVLLQPTQSGVTIPTVTTLTSHTPQTGDSFAIVNHASYGNAKLVRSVTPANALDVDSANAAKTQGASITLSSTERNAIADATLARSLGTEAYAADGAVPTTAQMLFQIWSAISEFAITGGGTTKTSKKLNGTTTAMTFTITLDGSSKPVAISRTS